MHDENNIMIKIWKQGLAMNGAKSQLKFLTEEKRRLEKMITNEAVKVRNEINFLYYVIVVLLVTFTALLCSLPR